MNKTVVVVLILLILIVGALALIYVAPASPSGTGTSTSTDTSTGTVASTTSSITGDPAEVAAVQRVVTEFGEYMQRVSLQSPNAAPQMEQFYGPYVAPTLLAQWEDDPQTAPGRLTSSPWPDRIVIDTVVRQADGTYDVTGSVIEMTNTGESGSHNVSLTLMQINGTWKIAAWSGYPPAPSVPAQ